MPKITSVEPQQTLRLLRQNSGQVRSGCKRFNIFLDGVFAFGADEDLVVNQRLVVGKIFSQEDLKKFLYEAEVGKLMEKMYGLFSVRMRSEKEVRDYLKNLSFKRKLKEKEELSDLIIDATVERLKQKEMLNDLQFAKLWVEGRRRSKQKGINALKSELYKKGIGKEIIDEVLNQESRIMNQELSEEELAKLALEKKMRVWKNLPPQEFKKKAIPYLMRQGFDYSVIKEILGNLAISIKDEN